MSEESKRSRRQFSTEQKVAILRATPLDRGREYLAQRQMQVPPEQRTGILTWSRVPRFSA